MPLVDVRRGDAGRQNPVVRVGLLICDHVNPELREISGDYPAMFRELLEPLGVDLVDYEVVSGGLPASPGECEGWITTGSRCSVYDDEAWIRDLEAFVIRVVEANAPFAGICFGHQLLAQALGGQVAPAGVGWGVGVQEFVVEDPPDWIDPQVGSFRLLVSHRDQVVRLPDGARTFATAGYCPVGGFVVGEKAMGIQAHPEFVAPYAEALLDMREELIGAEPVARARESLALPVDRTLVATWVARFLGVVDETPAVRA